jgi:hypothetical protein
MSWLTKMVSKIGKQNLEQSAEEVIDAMPAAKCMTAEPVASAAGVTDQKEENPTKQRRYFVKTGVYMDNEAEVAAKNSAADTEVIPDRQAADLKTLFPKLSLR